MKMNELTYKCKNCQWLRVFKTQQQQETQVLREALELRAQPGVEKALEVVPILEFLVRQQQAQPEAEKALEFRAFK